MLFIFKRKKEEEEPKEEHITPQTDVLSDQIKQLSENIAGFSKTIRNLEARTQDIIERLDSIQEKVEIHEQELQNVKGSVEKMFVLYDWLMKQYNPFIEEEENIKKETVKNEIRVEEKPVESKKYLPLDEIREDPSFIAIIMGWLNYLVSKSNVEETLKALEYYLDVGWITEDVKIKLEKYLEGYSSVDCKNMPLTPEDHLVSLYIITKLKAGIEEGIIRFRDLYAELVNKGIIRPIR